MTTSSETLKINGSESVNMMSHETSSFVDPYSLLGVNINSQIEEVRRAYYDLSLICHPDKGGCSEDMACVQAAYHFVKEGIQATGESKVRVGRFEELLSDYRVGWGVSQRFDDIGHPAFNPLNAPNRMHGEVCSFDHKAFESLPDTQVIRSTIRQAPSIPFIVKEEVYPITDQVDKEKGAGPSHASITALVVCSPVQTRDLFLDWQLDETKMEEFDFGTDAPMNMFDYGTAFAADTTLALRDPREKRTCIEDILKEREDPFYARMRLKNAHILEEGLGGSAA